MKPFQHILVGVDLSQGDWLATAGAESPSHFACEHAIALARESGGAVHFMATLCLDAKARWFLEQTHGSEENVLEQAEKALHDVVAMAHRAGVTGTSSVILGSSRVELACQAQQAQDDLLVIGSRHHPLLHEVLLGSTGYTLLRTAPCPLWIVKPSPTPEVQKILVATDFSPVCLHLLQLALEMARLFGAELHVVHVVEAPSRPFLHFTTITDAAMAEAHQQAMATAEKQLADLWQLPELVEPLAALQVPLERHLLTGRPSEVIRQLVLDLEVDLLVLGTVAWSGVPGMVIGSTAQKLLPMVPCSLLTARPEALKGFMIANL